MEAHSSPSHRRPPGLAQNSRQLSGAFEALAIPTNLVMTQQHRAGQHARRRRLHGTSARGNPRTASRRLLISADILSSSRLAAPVFATRVRFRRSASSRHTRAASCPSAASRRPLASASHCLRRDAHWAARSSRSCRASKDSQTALAACELR